MTTFQREAMSDPGPKSLDGADERRADVPHSTLPERGTGGHAAAH